MNADRLLALYDRIAGAPDVMARLRRFVLDVATRGKLVAQNPADEPASELLRRILAKKARLLSVGELKPRKLRFRPRQVPLEFDIPQGWELVDLGSIAFKITDGAHKTPTYVDKGVPFVSVKDFSSGRLDLSNTRYIRPSEHKVLYKRCDPRRGDILIGRIGTLGKAVIVDTDAEFSLFVSVGLIRFDHANIDPKFIRLLLNSPFVADEFERIKIGGATHTNKLNLGDLHTVALLLPPLKEQHRIVDKVDELTALCDRLEEARTTQEETRDRLANAALTRLSDPDTDPATFQAHARFAINALPALTARPDQVKPLRETILDLAVWGKLVEQDPADEPASELLKRFSDERAECAQLETTRRRMKREHVSPINPSAMDMPSGWEIAPLADILAELRTGPFGSSLHQRDYEIGGTPVINPVSIQGGTIVPLDKLAVGASTVARLERFRLRASDVVMARRGEMGRCALVSAREDGWLCGTGCLILRWPPSVYPEYLALLIGSPYVRGRLSGSAVGGTMQNLNQSILLSLSIPLPPLPEQHRIVAKFRELMSVCDELEKQLSRADTIHRQLTESAFHHADA